MAKSELRKELAARLHHMLSAAANSPCPADDETCEDCLIEAGIWITRCREAAKDAILNGYAETPEICKSIGVQTGIDIALEAVEDSLR